MDSLFETILGKKGFTADFLSDGDKQYIVRKIRRSFFQKPRVIKTSDGPLPLATFAEIGVEFGKSSIV